MEGAVKNRKNRSPCLRLFLLSIPSSSTQVVIHAGACQCLHQSEWVIKSYCSIPICTMKHIRTSDMVPKPLLWMKQSVAHWGGRLQFITIQVTHLSLHIQTQERWLILFHLILHIGSYKKRLCFKCHRLWTVPCYIYWMNWLA